MNVYDSLSYRAIINNWVNEQEDRGSKTRLAQSAQCNPSWMSRVLTGEVHLTPDQAYGLAECLQLHGDELDYFLYLVEYERAGSPGLRKRLLDKMEKLKDFSQQLDSSNKESALLLGDQRIRYYSSWIYSLVHVSCMVPGSMEDLSARLKLPMKLVKDTLLALEEMGLTLKKQGKWEATSKNIHLLSNDPLAISAHANLRNLTVQYLQKLNTEGFHYSAIHSLSKKDAENIRNQLKTMILECRSRIESSKDETLQVLCVDWYSP